MYIKTTIWSKSASLAGMFLAFGSIVGGTFVFPSIASAVAENTCVDATPSASAKISSFETSDESSLQTILDNAGYNIDTSADETGFQSWGVPAGTDSVTFTAKLIEKIAGNTNIFGYYVNGDASNFISVFSVPPTVNGATSDPVTIDTADITSIAFAVRSIDSSSVVKTFATEISAAGSDSMGEDHAVVYNPSSNKYVLAFEDMSFPSGVDRDYNDLVVDLVFTGCTQIPVEINTAPIAEDLFVATEESTTTSSIMIATDSDMPADTLTYATTTSPTNGIISGFDSLTGAFTYTPNLNYNGADSFKFKANDGTADSNEGTVFITINAITPAPVENASGLCSDGIDNDGDGMTDLADPDCAAFIPSAPSGGGSGGGGAALIPLLLGGGNIGGGSGTTLSRPEPIIVASDETPGGSVPSIGGSGSTEGGAEFASGGNGGGAEGGNSGSVLSPESTTTEELAFEASPLTQAASVGFLGMIFGYWWNWLWIILLLLAIYLAKRYYDERKNK